MGIGFVRHAGEVVAFPNARGNGDSEAAVERVNPYPLYELGKQMRTIAAYVGDVAPMAALWDILGALSSLGSLLENKPFPLGLSRRAAEEVRGALNEIWSVHMFADKADGTGREFRYPNQDDPPIQSWRWDNIRASLTRFETIHSAEIGEITTYFVPRRGIYSTVALVDAADESFPLELRQYIPQKTKDDWREAGRCLAFNLLSASGFHVARAVEGTMEAYYQLFSGKPGKTLRSWDDYHKELAKIVETKPTPAPERKTLLEFDQMREDYRNPIVHPRVNLDDADARILFNKGESLIIAMAKELKAAHGGIQPSLAIVGGSSAPAALPAS